MHHFEIWENAGYQVINKDGQRSQKFKENGITLFIQEQETVL